MTISGENGTEIFEATLETIMPNFEARNEKLDLRLTPSAKCALEIAAQIAPLRQRVRS